MEVNRPVRMLLQSITLARGPRENEFKYEKFSEGKMMGFYVNQLEG